MPTVTTVTTASTAPEAATVRHGSALATYVAVELRRQLRMPVNLMFVVGLPLLLFLIFGGMQNFSDTELPGGRGNVLATVMVAFAAYGAITATASQAGAAALELTQGWGRQLGITPLSRANFITAKTVVAVIIAILPIAILYLAGILTHARMLPWVWWATAALCLIAAIVFALYGLAVGTVLRSESAVGGASGIIVIFMFLGNAFTPLSGFLLDLAPYTPVWGVMQIAQWPLLQGQSVTSDGGVIQYELWMPIVNVLAWAAIFGSLAVRGARRGRGRG